MGYRYRLKFEKTNRMRFIGHLDLLRLFQRTFNRAGLPVCYSQGFNPHQLLSFALPLPIGMEGLGEYADIELECEWEEDEVVGALNGKLPAGLVFLTAKKIDAAERKAAALVDAADYVIRIGKVFDPETFDAKAVERLLAQKEIIVQKKTKSGCKTADIRPDIICAAWQGDHLTARLSAGGTNFLKPQLFVECLHEGQAYDPYAVFYTRKNLLTQSDGGYRGLLREI